MPPVSSSMPSLPSCARLPKSAIFFSISAKRELVGVAQDRHHQAARAADRDADVEVAVVDDVVAVDRGVDDRELLQRVHRRLHEERHEAQPHAVLLLEALLVLLAQLHHRLHVHFVERGEDGGGRLRLHQALGDARAQARHRHALLRPPGQELVDVYRGGRRRQRRTRGGRPGSDRHCERLRPAHLVQHVGLGDAAVAAGAVIFVGSTPCSSASLRAAGMRRASWRAASGAGGGVGGTAAGSPGPRTDAVPPRRHPCLRCRSWR